MAGHACRCAWIHRQHTLLATCFRGLAARQLSLYARTYLTICNLWPLNRSRVIAAKSFINRLECDELQGTSPSACRTASMTTSKSSRSSAHAYCLSACRVGRLDFSLDSRRHDVTGSFNRHSLPKGGKARAAAKQGSTYPNSIAASRRPVLRHSLMPHSCPADAALPHHILRRIL